MFANQFVRVTNGFTDRQRQAAELLIAGVAFQRDNRTFDVISHEGDQIGTISMFIASETACMLKKAGLKMNNSPYYQGPNVHPTPPFPGAQVITFAHNGFPPQEIQQMMERRFKRPLTLL